MRDSRNCRLNDSLHGEAIQAKPSESEALLDVAQHLAFSFRNSIMPRSGYAWAGHVEYNA